MASILVHGGAGVWPRRARAAACEGCRRAAREGWAILADGGRALDAVERAVRVLEDDPQFNAGTGSVLNRAGTVEMDASIMDGARLAAGAVGAVRHVRNPVLLARRILDAGRHVLLVGPGAEDYARRIGLPLCADRDLVVPGQRARWKARHGTCGAVAVDEYGDLAAATSTGGVFDKAPGRVGDSACIGCGTLADELAAVSCTGIGEAIIRTVLASRARARLAAGRSPREAARRAVEELGTRTGAEAGLIMVDLRGRVGYACNARQMPVAWRSRVSPLRSAI